MRREEQAVRFADHDEASLARSIEALLADRDGRTALAARGRRTYERHFSPERMVERLASALTE